jgi:hypothetical protein
MSILNSFFLLFISSSLFAQPFTERVLDSVVNEAFQKQGLHQMTITWSEYEGTPLTKIQTFNSQGLRTENLFFNGNRWVRHKETYDSLSRRTSFTFFDEKDTSVITSTHIYTYPDTMTSREETFNMGTELTETKLTQYRKNADTIWITETETYSSYSRINKNLTRITQKGDSLTIVEYVGFDDSGKMKDIDTYYHLSRKDKKGNSIRTSGKYEVVVDESLQNDQELYIDVIKYPEKYIQYQLDGKYPYVYGEEITSIMVFDPKGRLISNKDYDSKTNYFYNAQGQITKTESFYKSYDNPKEEKTSEQIYHYDSRGLPLNVVETRFESGKVITYIYAYK